MSNSTIKPKISTEKFIIDCGLIHGNFYDYSQTIYTGAHNYLNITCPVHGLFKIKAYAHKGGKQGCSHCGKIKANVKKSIKFNEFLKRSISKHGDFYTYDESTYISMAENTKITCPDHGDFIQSAGIHSLGHGCPKCGRNLNGFARTNFKNLCDKNNHGIGTLYLIKCWDESELFYKVGITSHKNKKARFHGKFMPYSYEFVFLIDDDASIIYDLETQIHRLLRSYKYAPLLHFKGETECFKKIPRKVMTLISSMSNSNQMLLAV